MARRYFGGYGSTQHGCYEKKPCSTPRREVAAPKPSSPEEEAARGLLARRAVRAVRDAEREAQVVLAPRVAAVLRGEKASGRGDARAKLAVAEELMRLLLRLDAVRGERAYRRRVVARVLALQDAVDTGGA